MTDDLGACPKCGQNEWEYTEVEMWAGRRCEGCGGTFLHKELGLPEGETR